MLSKSDSSRLDSGLRIKHEKDITTLEQIIAEAQSPPARTFGGSGWRFVGWRTLAWTPSRSHDNTDLNSTTEHYSATAEDADYVCNIHTFLDLNWALERGDRCD